MEPASTVDRFSAIASQHNYVLLVGQPLTDLPHAAWFIPLHPVPSQPLALGQRILLASSTSRTYFGQIKSIVRLEKSYLVISVSPESSAYGPFIPLPCHVYLPTSFLVLPPLRHLQYSMFVKLFPWSADKPRHSFHRLQLPCEVTEPPSLLFLLHYLLCSTPVYWLDTPKSVPLASRGV